MEPPVSRRQLLGAGSAAVALSVAGCSALNDDGLAGDHEVTFIADIDDEAIQAAQAEAQTAQQEAREQLEAGEIDQEEAQQIVQEARTELEETQQRLLSEAIEAIETHASEVDGLEITDSAPESGAALGSGDGNAILETLALDSTQAIVDGTEFDEFASS